jgi:hypothetical protein
LVEVVLEVDTAAALLDMAKYGGVGDGVRDDTGHDSLVITKQEDA